jgi:hypothetical protein
VGTVEVISEEELEEGILLDITACVDKNNIFFEAIYQIFANY